MLIGSYAWDHNRWERALINSSCKLSSIDSGFRQAHKPTSEEDGLDNLRHACYFKPSLFVIPKVEPAQLSPTAARVAAAEKCSIGRPIKGHRRTVNHQTNLEVSDNQA